MEDQKQADGPETMEERAAREAAAQAMVPHDQRDFRRVGLVILCAGIPLDLIAWHFSGQSSPQDLHAALFFAFGGLLLHAVGGVIAFRAFFGSPRG
ncbi:MAG TPA: hypothetical protein PLQ97_10840 [Myxococcota bacterium]|nr:hypothetical protein [Myxococcota bacterium]HQK51547.1 hypothetical protein [Myxococcota bacterium]